MDVMRYAVILERGPSNWGAHVPDLPGCVAVGESEADVLERIRRSVPEHIKALQEVGQPVPEPVTHVDYAEV